MNYCSHCGGQVTLQVPAGDSRERYVCSSCGMIHYSNPNNVCGALLTWKNRILLCRRAIEPRYGLWTLPAGFMENGESVADAALRETREEANASAVDLDLFGVFSLPHISQVYIMFSGELEHTGFSPGSESLETRLFEVKDIPWDELAFPVISFCLKLYLQQPRDQVHTYTAIRHPDRSVSWHQ